MFIVRQHAEGGRRGRTKGGIGDGCGDNERKEKVI